MTLLLENFFFVAFFTFFLAGACLETFLEDFFTIFFFFEIDFFAIWEIV